MISSTRQIQGHFLGVDTDTSTTVHFRQRTRDFDALGNILYVALALGVAAATAYALADTGLHDALIVLIVACVGAATIALRIAITTGTA